MTLFSQEAALTSWLMRGPQTGTFPGHWLGRALGRGISLPYAGSADRQQRERVECSPAYAMLCLRQETCRPADTECRCAGRTESSNVHPRGSEGQI